jgi:hypothetical protein
VASLVCPLYLADHITSTFAYKNLSVVFVPEYSHDNSCHNWLGWMHNGMKLLSCVGNLVEVVIPRPGPTGEEVPGVGKVCDLHLHLPFFLSECEYCKVAN